MPPKKGQKMSLNDFLADESTGKTSWADEMDDLAISSAPRESSYRRGADYLSTVPDRVDRDRDRDRGFERPERGYPPRDELPLPDKPPFTAFVGNLSFDVTDADVDHFFAPANTVSVRIVTGHDGKPKGFGYVQFHTLDDLKSALDRSGSQLASRTLRISVAEPPKSAFGGDRPLHSSQADDASQWRRAGPLPPVEPRGAFAARPERSGVPRSEGSGFDNMDVSGGVRSGFGAKFQSAPPSTRPPREATPLEPSQGDLATQWRTGKPVEARSPATSRRGSAIVDSDSRRSSFRTRSDANDVDERFASQERMGFGSKFTPDHTSTTSESAAAGAKKGFGFGVAERRTSGQHTPSGAGSDTNENWRSVRKPTSGSSSPTTVSVERKKLDLKPRSTDSVLNPPPSTAPTTLASLNTSKPSPFGNAKPIDKSERERQIEHKLSQREKERHDEIKARKEKLKPQKQKSDSNIDIVQSTNPNLNIHHQDVGFKTQSVAPSTGAWGGGRKPSGALVGGDQLGTKHHDSTVSHDVDDVDEKVRLSNIDA